MPEYDAVVVGSGPNGIAAAIKLQQEGLSTLIVEQASKPGGATRTEELTLPGFKHDIGSSIHPLTIDSPFFRTLPLEEHGLKWIFPEIPFAHPFEDEDALACFNDIDKTADQLGRDKAAYQSIFHKMLNLWPSIEGNILAPLQLPFPVLPMVKFGINAIQPASLFNKLNFQNDKTKCFFYGAAAHSTLPLNNAGSAAFGMMLFILAHKRGWPFPEGGASKINEALLSYYKSIGGKINLNYYVDDISKLPKHQVVMFDVTPRQLLKIKETKFSGLYRKRLSSFKYGAGVFKVDWALKDPIPWKNEKCRKAGTIHLGFSIKELEDSEKLIYQNRIFSKPYVLLAQHSLFDSTRAPEGQHTAWAYCHVPNGSSFDMTEYIENQVEKAAPGFKKTIIGRSTKNTYQMESFDPNLVNGDINGGKNSLMQMFMRPVFSFKPYQTSNPNIYICSSSTPPGGGVHGMCGYNAAEAVIKDHY